MYKKLLAMLPVVAATVVIASSLKQEYTEPELITGAASGVTASVVTTVEEIALPEEITLPETTAEPETTAAPETIIVPETASVPETTAAPEITVAPETTAAPVTTAAPAAEAIAPQEDTVYWVKSGEVWHTKASCSTLSRSKDILSGTVDAAKEAGKERVCKRCG